MHAPPHRLKALLTARRSRPLMQQRVHNFTPTRFHVPTWCTHCKLFVWNPFGIQGYHCDRCNAQIHKDCLGAASQTPCGTTSYAPPMTPRKMNAIFAQVTQKAISGNYTAATCTLSAHLDVWFSGLICTALDWDRFAKLVADLVAMSSQNSNKISKAAFSKMLPMYVTGRAELVEEHWWNLCRGDDADADVRHAAGVLALLSQNVTAQKLEFLFSLYDAKQDGHLIPTEFSALCSFVEEFDCAWLADDVEYRDMAIASIHAVHTILLEAHRERIPLAAWREEAIKYRTIHPLLERLQMPVPGDVVGKVAQQWRLPSFEGWMTSHAPMPLYVDEWEGVLTTGSVMLAAGGEAISKLIMKATWSTWSHAALIIRDPPQDVRAKYNADANERFFVFESDTMTLDGKVWGGVQLVPLRKWLEVEMEYCHGEDGRAVVRALKIPSVNSAAEEWEALGGLRAFMLEMHGRGYKRSAKQLVNVAVRKNQTEDLSTVFCSELVAAGLQAAGLLGDGQITNNYLPKDFESSTAMPLPLLCGAALQNEMRFYRHRPGQAPKKAVN